MSIFLKVVGFFLLIAGLYGVVITLPELLLNLTLDEINPLIMLGLVESGTPATIFDLILSMFLIGIAIVFLRTGGKPKIIPR